MAGLEGIEGEEAGGELVVGKAGGAEQFAEKFGGGTIAFAGVAIETASNHISKGVIAAGGNWHDVVKRRGFGAEIAETIEAGIVFTAEDGGAEAAVVETIGGVEFFKIAWGIRLHTAGDFVGEENVERVTGEAAVGDADAALFGEVTEMKSRGGRAGAEARAEASIGDERDAFAFGARVAQQVVVHGAFAAAQAKVGHQVVLDVFADSSEVEWFVHEISPGKVLEGESFFLQPILLL
jgi:hypothetical protein